MPYPLIIPADIPFHHEGTKSSDGKQTTPGANTSFDFSATPINCLEVTNHGTSDMTIKLNSETNTHLIESGGTIYFDKIHITGFTIVENGANYSYSACYYIS